VPDPATTAPTPLLVDARAAARMLGVGKTKLYSMLSAGQVPAPIRLGRAVRWRASELCDWCAAGCPSREVWENTR